MLRVMVAEDETLVRNHIVELLTAAGCDVVSEHGDGESAFRWLEKNPCAVDAMFLDIRMPRVSGLEVAAWCQGLPAVFITGWQEHAIQAFDLGAVDYLVKPVSQERVARSVDRLRALIESDDSADTAAMVHVREGRSREGVLGVESVEAFEVEDREIFAWSGGKRYLALGLRTLKEVQKTFPGIAFKRAGRNRLEREVVS